MEKKNFKKVSNKRQSKQTLNPNDKKFSKAQFRKEVKENTNEKKTIVKQNNRSSKNVKNYDIPTKFEFKGNPSEEFIAILLNPSLEKKGYSTFSKGQCVLVEKFGKEVPFVRLKAQDGRIGIANCNSTEFKRI